MINNDIDPTYYCCCLLTRSKFRCCLLYLDPWPQDFSFNQQFVDSILAGFFIYFCILLVPASPSSMNLTSVQQLSAAHLGPRWAGLLFPHISVWLLEHTLLPSSTILMAPNIEFLWLDSLGRCWQYFNLFIAISSFQPSFFPIVSLSCQLSFQS